MDFDWLQSNQQFEQSVKSSFGLNTVFTCV